MNTKAITMGIRRAISGIVASAIALSSIPAMAAENEKYPYTLFAASSEDGAITTTAYNFCINGNVCTNGTIVANGNLNVNGTKTENAGQDMIHIFDKIDTKYFTTGNVDEHTEDYVLDEINININVPTEVLGETELTGNININTALKSFEDINLFGEVKNTNDSVIYSKYGDVIIDSTNVNLNGLVYAPFGDVEITAQNLNLNNVVIIADSITLDCPNVNANYSTNAGELVGTVSEALNIPKDEWQYMKDENGNGLPDFFEDFENWEQLADTDGDGLPDSIEEYLGSNANNIDTDNDGLNDYYEIFGTYTDPTKADTDENSVDDGEEDFDEDGLTNLQEFSNETHPYDDDSDFDGLSDGDEFNVYNTDPLTSDTDGEGLLDGDEIVLGTDPLVQDTDADGTLDCDEKFNQTFTHKVFNEDCAVAEVSVTMDCTGNINKTTTVDSVMNIDILSSEVVGLIGEPFEIETTSEFDAATIAFKVDTEKLGDTEFDNLLFLWYDEENCEFVELETILDEENSIVSTVTTHFSKYMIVDSRAWYDAWRTNLDYSGGLESMPVDTVLVIDKSGSMDYSDIDMITDAANCYIDTMKQGDRAAIVTFASSASLRYALTDNKIELSKSLSGITPGGGTNFDAAILKALSVFDDDSRTRIVIFMSDGEDSVATTTLTKIDESGVIFHTVGYGSAKSTYLKDISKAGKGEYYEALYQEDLVEIYTDLSLFYNIDKTDTDGDGLYDAVETAGIRLLNGKIIYGCDPSDPDTDDDGLLDGEEIDPKPLYSTKEDNGWLDFKKYFGINTIQGYYFEMCSDPRYADSDYDGIDDNKDIAPYNNSFSGTMTDTYAEWDVSFNVDYREYFGDNTVFNNKLAILGSIYASLAYGDPHITITSGALQFCSITKMYETFGLVDIEDYKLADYYHDDDISEMIIGHRKVSYEGEKKDIIIISVRGTDSTIEEWSSNFDVGADTDAYWDRDNPYWRNKENHKGFDVAANRLFDLIDAYTNSYVDSDMQKVIYIVGHSRGAAIANILGSLYEDLPDYESYTYTFATPNTTTKTDFKNYNTVFNFVNEDDMVTYLPLNYWTFNKYGTTYTTSIKNNYEGEWEDAINANKKLLWSINEYNYNGHLQDTISAFEGLANNREELYEYTDNPNTVYTYPETYLYDNSEYVQERIEKYGERIARHCQVNMIISDYEQIDTTHYAPEQAVYSISVKQTPAFLMMNLAYVTAEKCHIKDLNEKDQIVPRSDIIHECEIIFLGVVPVKIGFNVAPKYKYALEKYCKSGADSSFFAHLNWGGITHAHMPATYYFISSVYTPT